MVGRGEAVSYQDLPMCCRQCGQRKSQYLHPTWTHGCLKGKPMIEGCQWKQARHPNFQESERAGSGN